MVLLQPRAGRHGHVGAGGVAELERQDGDLPGVELWVAAGSGEERHLDAPGPQPLDQGPAERLESAGEGLPQRVAGRGEDHDVHASPRIPVSVRAGLMAGLSAASAAREIALT